MRRARTRSRAPTRTTRRSEIARPDRELGARPEGVCREGRFPDSSGPRPACPEAYRSTILEHLVLAGKEPGYADAAKDPLFNEFSTALRYRVATGTALSNLAGLAVGLVIYAPAAGVYGSQEKLTLAPGGLLQREVLAFTEADEPVRRSTDLPNGWSIDGDALKIDTGDGPVRVTIDPAFRFVTDAGELRWVDSDSECEA